MRCRNWLNFITTSIYVHERQGTALHETRAWLRQHEFPVGITRNGSSGGKSLVGVYGKVEGGRVG